MKQKVSYVKKTIRLLAFGLAPVPALIMGLYLFTRRMAEFVEAALSELQGPQGVRPWRPEPRGADKALAEEALLHSRGETSALSLHT